MVTLLSEAEAGTAAFSRLHLAIFSRRGLLVVRSQASQSFAR